MFSDFYSMCWNNSKFYFTFNFSGTEIPFTAKKKKKKKKKKTCLNIKYEVNASENIWKEKKHLTEFWLVSVHAVNISDHLNENLSSY